MNIQAVIFDLDGTLTVPRLDFDAIRREIGDIHGPILEALMELPHPQRQRAQAILLRHEREAAENAELHPGAAELIHDLRRQNRRLALITRNTRDHTAIVCRKYDLAFDLIITREDGPYKPDPFPVQRACRELHVHPDRALMVGDFLHDLVSAQRAGVRSVLLTTHKKWPDYQQHADFVINDLRQLSDLLTDLDNPPTASAEGA